MNTVTVELKSNVALQILKNLESANLIHIVEVQQEKKSVIDSIFSLDDAVKAHNKMLNGKGLFGKILIKPNPNE